MLHRTETDVLSERQDRFHEILHYHMPFDSPCNKLEPLQYAEIHKNSTEIPASAI